jgi:hypothetical protein
LLLLLSLTFSAINAQESQRAPSPKPAANDEQMMFCLLISYGAKSSFDL